jgi:hypothetical protein
MQWCAASCVLTTCPNGVEPPIPREYQNALEKNKNHPTEHRKLMQNDDRHNLAAHLATHRYFSSRLAFVEKHTVSGY